MLLKPICAPRRLWSLWGIKLPESKGRDGPLWGRVLNIINQPINNLKNKTLMTPKLLLFDSLPKRMCWSCGGGMRGKEIWHHADYKKEWNHVLLNARAHLRETDWPSDGHSHIRLDMNFTQRTILFLKQTTILLFFLLHGINNKNQKDYFVLC